MPEESLDENTRQRLRTQLTADSDWFDLGDVNGVCVDGPGIWASNAQPDSAAWTNKTPTDILADVNAALAALHEPPPLNAYASVPLMGVRAYDALMRRQPGPIPGSFWDFDKLVIPMHQWVPLKAAFDRRQREFLRTWYRAKQRHRRLYVR